MSAKLGCLCWNVAASAMTCFETRLGCIEADRNSWHQQMIDTNYDIFRLSLKLRFSIPLYKLFSTPTWRKLVQSEDFFFGYIIKIIVRFLLVSCSSFFKNLSFLWIGHILVPKYNGCTLYIRVVLRHITVIIICKPSCDFCMHSQGLKWKHECGPCGYRNRRLVGSRYQAFCTKKKKKRQSGAGSTSRAANSGKL